MNLEHYQSITYTIDDKLKSSFKRAITTYESGAESKYHNGLINLATKLGTMRSPLHHDIVIHPEFPFVGNLQKAAFPEVVVEQIDAEYEKYRSEIQKVIDSNQKAIILLFGGENIIKQDPYLENLRINYRDRLVLISDYHLRPELVSGRINGKDLAIFLSYINGLNPEDKFRLHGSDLSDCVSDFAIQLYSLLHLNQFQPAWKKQSMRILQSSVRDAINKLGLINDSNIRAGTVFDDRNTWLYCLRQAPTAIPMQLVDENSRVIPSQSCG